MQYYAEDTSAVPFRLLCVALKPMMPWPAAWLVAVLIRLGGKLGFRLPLTYGVGYPDTETEIDPQELPPGAISLWAPILEQLRDLGFQPLKCERMATVGTKLHCSTVLLNQPGNTTAILEWTRMMGAKGIEENTPLEFNSYVDDAPDVVTGVVRKVDVPMSEMLQLESVEMISLENNRPLAESYQQHRQRCEGRHVLRLSEENALQVVRDRGQQRFEALLESGILCELSSAEVDRLREMDLTELHAF